MHPAATAAGRRIKPSSRTEEFSVEIEGGSERSTREGRREAIGRRELAATEGKQYSEPDERVTKINQSRYRAWKGRRKQHEKKADRIDGNDDRASRFIRGKLQRASYGHKFSFKKEKEERNTHTHPPFSRFAKSRHEGRRASVLKLAENRFCKISEAAALFNRERRIIQQIRTTEKFTVASGRNIGRMLPGERNV